MTGRKSQGSRPFTLRPGSSAFETGYGKPPQGSRFRPGQSGNPAGRPRGAKNRASSRNGERLREIIMEEAYREIPVRDGEKNVTMPMVRTVIRSLVVSAVKGNSRALHSFIRLLEENDRQEDSVRSKVVIYQLPDNGRD